MRLDHIHKTKYIYIDSVYVILDNERLKFDVTSSRSLNQPPSVQVTFSNGVQDELELTEYKPYGSRSNAGCNFLGRLRNDVASSAAVTGCLNKPGDIMEVTLISKNNVNKLFKVDFDGNTEVLANPFENGGNKEIKNAISLHIKLRIIMRHL